MKVGFIGAGKAASAVSAYWLSGGVEILGYYSRNIRSAEKAAASTGTRVFTSPAALAAAADLIMITTSDDAIWVVAETMAGLSIHWGDKIVCHISGALSSDILGSLYDFGATVCSLHPMISFGNIPSGAPDLKNVFFTFEGRGERLENMQDFLHALGHRYAHISPDQKALYHAAACILSNYFVALLDTGIQMLGRAGFSEGNIVDCIRPLIEKTWENVLEAGTVKALTGPIVRGDIGTVRLHMQRLLEEGREDWLEIYKTMGKSTVELALQAGRINPETASNIYEELQS